MTVTAQAQHSDSQQSNFQQNNAQSAPCVIIGHSIDAITTATVLATLGQRVILYADTDALAETLATYTFEHQQNALWQMYTSREQISVYAIPNQASELFCVSSTAKNNEQSPALYWLFYTDLPDSWRAQTQSSIDEPDIWITHLNDSPTPTQTPFILSGISQLGVFAELANACKRPWVYYVPFVFLQDGHTYASMLTPTLWLMGEKSKDSLDKLPLIQPLMAKAQQAYVTDIATTEFARSAIMSMLATRVSFMNEWSRLADLQGVDITEVSTIMGLDSRIGNSYLQASWGFGGRTLPAEIAALQDTLAGKQVQHQLMQAVADINDDQKELIFRKFWQYFDGKIDQKSVAIWGASYKAGSGRTSQSAIHPLLRLLWSYHIITYVYAAEAEAELASLYPDEPLLKFIPEPTDKLDKVDAVFVMSWSPSKRLPIAVINEVAVPVFDAQNAFSNEQINSLIGAYQGIGRRK